jgi:hypothetical protein
MNSYKICKRDQDPEYGEEENVDEMINYLKKMPTIVEK